MDRFSEFKNQMTAILNAMQSSIAEIQEIAEHLHSQKVK